ncbi:phosphotransferase [Leptolyngbya sp. KIOST-1]|uniref:phosphotransferase n=1 Tax=Leptolyngbya sp. KIOST-1 TaxID=1229172 RepID=UPI00055AB54D|nr:phosphotransferase [Leptolyngbya sp. KIOST-1]
MLCAADLALVERDRQLPGLATLLDDDAMLARLRSAGYAAAAIASTYLRYKPHTNCLVAYTVTSPGQHQPCCLYGKAYPLDRVEKLAKYQRMGQRARDSHLPPMVVDALGLAIAPFPLDRELRSVAQLLNSATRPKVCRKLLALEPDEAIAGEISLTTLNYKPERRYVGGLNVGADPSQRWVVKAYTQDDYDTARRNSRDICSGEVLAVAPLLGRSHRYQMLAFPWVEGQPLETAMQGDISTVHSTLQRVGVALGELHQQRLKRLQPMSCAAEALDVMELVSDLCYLQPSLAGRFKSLSRAIAEGLVHLPQQWHSTHGDFKPDQVLVKGDRITLLDFDRAARAHPARDLGSFLAQLDYQHLGGCLDDPRRRAAAAGLLQGYATQGTAPDPDTLRLYTALHLFKLLPEPFRYRAPDWPTRMEKLLHRIEGILQREEVGGRCEGWGVGSGE